MLASARMISSWQSPNILASQDVWLQTMLARPRTPRDPKSHFFVTKRAAVAPVGTLGPITYAEFWRESRQGGPAPSISTFVYHFGTPKNANMTTFGICFVIQLPSRRACRRPAAGPWGFHGTHGCLHGPPLGPIPPLGKHETELGCCQDAEGSAS